MQVDSAAVPPAVRALRGATTVDADTPEQVKDRVCSLVQEMLDRNGVDHDDIISIVFTATEDVTSVFPASAARTIGLGDVPLLCARELAIEHGMTHTIRVLMHFYGEQKRSNLHHVYLEGARSLRDDLPE